MIKTFAWMQVTTLTGFVLKRELNHVNREKSMNTLCSPLAGPKLNAIRPENWILKIKGETNSPLPYWLIISKTSLPPSPGWGIWTGSVKFKFSPWPSVWQHGSIDIIFLIVRWRSLQVKIQLLQVNELFDKNSKAMQYFWKQF